MLNVKVVDHIAVVIDMDERMLLHRSVDGQGGSDDQKGKNGTLYGGRQPGNLAHSLLGWLLICLKITSWSSMA